MSDAAYAEPSLVAEQGAAAAQTREVYTGLRLVRTFAMISIVGYHITWEPLFGIAFGLTSLQIIMCALAARPRKPRTLTARLAERRRRLLTPWLAWSALYACFEVTRAVVFGRPALGFLEPWMWASGASFHLWFLPYAFVAALVVHGLVRLLAGVRAEVSTLGMATVGALLLAWLRARKASWGLTMPFDLWADGLPAIAFGVALGRALAIADRERRAGVCFGALALATLAWYLGGALAERYVVAVAVVCLGLMWRPRERVWMSTLASLNLGVYLVHMLILRVCDHLPGFAQLATQLQVVCAYALCVGCVLLLRRARVPFLSSV